MNIKDFDMYQMTEERQKKLWSDCVFVFDTSALLALYLCPEEARNQIYTEIFEKIKGRLWMPHHVQFEYLKNRVSKIKEPITKSYIPLKEDFIKPIVDSFNKSLNRVDTLKNNIKKAENHPHMVAEDLEVYEAKLKEFVKTTVEFEKKFNEQMEQKVNEILLLEKNDTVLQNLRKYFKVGREYTYEEIMQITLEGKHRYEFKIPPGYEDQKNKIGIQMFGDLIIWKQILEYAKEHKKNVVFVCNDVKEDWWQLIGDKKTEKKKADDPRKELIKEFKDYSGTDFWMYNQAKFLNIANTLIKSKVSGKYIEQISHLITAKALNQTLIYKCEACKTESKIDTSTLVLDVESVNRGLERHKKTENIYLAEAKFNCKNCDHNIQALFEIWEYPIGTVNHQQIKLKGASLITEGRVKDEFLLDDLHDELNTEIDLETFVINKKEFRLKSGKAKKITFPKIIDGDDTLFVIEYSKQYAKIQGKSLDIEVYNTNKLYIGKTLALENTMTKFVMRTDEEPFLSEFLYMKLTSNTDITITISVIEYPGTGRYIEKLYY
ncbi:MAG: PIN-like domain-containing protein [Bacteroidota bacterium]